MMSAIIISFVIMVRSSRENPYYNNSFRDAPSRCLPGSRLPVSLQTVLAAQGLLDLRGHEAVDGAVQGTDLLDDRGRKIAVLQRRHHEQRFHVLADAAVHLGDLELVLEIRDGPQTPDDDMGLPAGHIIDQQTGKGIHRDPLLPLYDLTDHVD